MAQKDVHVGIVGAGIGGLLAAIALRRAAAKVTVLEAAQQLGEIGAGIQMTPNVSRLLMDYGVDKMVGNNLVRFTDLHLRGKDGTPLGHASISRVEQATGFPWWVVHRHHLHTGLAEVANNHGVNIHIDSRIAKIEQTSGGKVSVVTNGGMKHVFDLCVGADGLQSITRKTLFPNVNPKPPTGNCAYRAIVPFEEVRADPATRELVEDEHGNPKRTMEVWMAPTGYIISYPISDAKDFNMVLSHFHDPPVEAVQEVNVEDVKKQYSEYDPRIRKVIDKIKAPISRWPLMVTGPLESWSNPEKNIVLMGDAAHSMVNHMAQGAATSMEDGAFLARCVGQVVQGAMSLPDAVRVYEKGRMPKASYKQQISFLNGWLWHLPDGPAQEARDKAMEGELRGEVLLQSPNLYSDPWTVRECYGYDAEAHADEEIATWLNGGKPVRDMATTVVQNEAEKIANWFLPEEHKFRVRSRL